MPNAGEWQWDRETSNAGAGVGTDRCDGFVVEMIMMVVRALAVVVAVVV